MQNNLDSINGIKAWVRHETYPQYYAVVTVNDNSLFISDSDIDTIIFDFDSDILTWKAFFDDMYSDNHLPPTETEKCKKWRIILRTVLPYLFNHYICLKLSLWQQI